MQRDWELARTILLKLEEMGSTASYLRADQVQGYDREIVAYHMQLLNDAGLIRAKCSQELNGPLDCWAFSLTWNGHEFLDSIRQDNIWNKVKATTREKGLSLSFDVIVAVAKSIIESLI